MKLCALSLLLLLSLPSLSVSQNNCGDPSSKESYKPVAGRGLWIPALFQKAKQAKLLEKVKLPDSDDEGFSHLSDATLGDLVQASTLIVVGQVLSCSSRLSDYSIITNYSVVPQLVLKGKSPATLELEGDGGEVTFANGSAIRQTTATWSPMKVGERLVFFLIKLVGFPGEPYAIAGSTAGLIRLPHYGSNVYIISKHGPSRGRPLEAEVEGLSEPDLLAKLKQTIKTK